MDFLLHALLVGCGATALVDLWVLLRRRLFGMPLPDYGQLGRWLGHMPRGRFRHAPIAAAAPVRGERPLGWVVHYLIGIAFAALLLALAGHAWIRQPTPGPALAVGIATVAAPWFVMQPAFGLGVAASRAPRPSVARLHSLLTHVVFGAGLYLAGWIVSRTLA